RVGFGDVAVIPLSSVGGLHRIAAGLPALHLTLNSPMGSPSDHSAAALARQRLAIVLSHPVQYYAPWFRTIAAGTALTIRVFYLSDHGVAAHQDAQFSRSFAWDTDLLSGYDHEFVPNTARHPDVTRFQGLKNP